MSDRRIDKLYEEIYADESGGFLGFFSSSDKNKQKERRLETYYSTNESTSKQRDPRMSPPGIRDEDFSSNSKNFNTYRDAQLYKEEYLLKKRQRRQMKQTAKDIQAQNDPMYQLWQELQDQDEELIFNDNTLIVNDFSYNTSQKIAITSMSNLYASGIESSRAHISMPDISIKSRGDSLNAQMMLSM